MISRVWIHYEQFSSNSKDLMKKLPVSLSYLVVVLRRSNCVWKLKTMRIICGFYDTGHQHVCMNNCYHSIYSRTVRPLLHCKCFDYKNYGDWKLQGPCREHLHYLLKRAERTLAESAWDNPFLIGKFYYFVIRFLY